MKKIAIATLIALAATAASALEVGVVSNRDTSNDRDAAGVTVGQKFGRMSATAGFERASKSANDQDRWSLVGGYDLTKFGPATVTAKAGAAYLNNQTGADGYALVAGVGVSVPVTKSISATVDVTRQAGQERVKAHDGNRVAVGLKYSF